MKRDAQALLQIAQRSPEWYEARIGCITASMVWALTARPASGKGYSRVRASYISQLACERLTGKQTIRYCGPQMRNAVHLEPKARDLYAARMRADVAEVGFVLHPTMKGVGASPDGHVLNSRGKPVRGLEIKCPEHAAHYDLLLGKAIDKKYLQQMHLQRACDLLPSTDFVSFNEDFPPGLDMVIINVAADQDEIAAIEYTCFTALDELDRGMDALAARLAGKMVKESL